MSSPDSRPAFHASRQATLLVAGYDPGTPTGDYETVVLLKRNEKLNTLELFAWGHRIPKQ